MRKITLDFKNRWVLILTDEQFTSEDMWQPIQKATMKDFLPQDKSVYMRGDNFTLDFEANVISLNESIDYDQTGKYPELNQMEVYPFENLNMLWDEVLERMGYVMVSMSSDAYSDSMDTISFLNGL